MRLDSKLIKFLMAQGFQVQTLQLLTKKESLEQLAAEYGYKG